MELLLQLGVSTAVTVALEGLAYFYYDLPNDGAAVILETSEHTADLDLYGNPGTIPGVDNGTFALGSWNGGLDPDSFVVPGQAGQTSVRWYFAVYGYEAGSCNITLRALPPPSPSGLRYEPVWSDEFDSPLTLGVGYVPVGSTPNGNVVYDKYFQNGGATSGGALGPPPDVYPANSLFAGLGISPGALGSYNGFIPTGSTFYVPFYGSDHEGVSLEITLDRPYASGMWINLEMGSSLAGPYPFTTFYGNSNTVSGSVWFDGDNLRYLKASGVPPVQFADVNDNLLIGRTNFRLVVFKAGGILLLADDTVVTSVNYVDLTGFLAIDTFILGANNAKIDSFSISYATYSAIPDFWTSLVNTRELAQ